MNKEEFLTRLRVMFSAHEEETERAFGIVTLGKEQKIQYETAVFEELGYIYLRYFPDGNNPFACRVYSYDSAMEKILEWSLRDV